MSNPFNRSKNYRNLNFQEGQMGFDKDFNHDANLTRDQVEQSMIGLLGWSLVRQSALVPPVPISGLRCDVQVNDQINFSENGNGNGRYSFAMIDATHIQWKYNDNAWNDNGGIGFLVICDGATWNYDVGTSGFDFIFHADTNTGDAQIIIASKGMRLAGGEIITPILPFADRVCLYHGYWLLQDRWVDLDGTDLDGVVDGDLMYVKITETEVDYTIDADLEHRLPGGSLYPVCPSATQVEYEVLSCQPLDLPDDTSTEKHIVICGLDNNAGVVTPTPVWSKPWDLQKLVRYCTGDIATFTGCLISIVDNPPTVALSAYSNDELRGVEVAITNIPANTQKMTIWTGPEGIAWDKDGSSFYNTIDFDSDAGFSTTKTIIIPEDPSGGLEVEVQCIDENGLYHGDSIGAVGFVGSGTLPAWTVSCLISLLDNPPTVALSRYSKDDGLRGVEVAITNIPANTQKMTIWAGEQQDLALGVGGMTFYKTIDFDSDAGFSTTKTLIIPEGHYSGGTGNGGLDVGVQCIDENGTYHGESVGAVGFITLEELVPWTDPWIDNTFIVGKGGCKFSTIQSAIDAVHDSGVSDAEIHIHGGEYTEDLSFDAAFACNLTIKGFTRAQLTGDIDLNDIKSTSLSGYDTDYDFPLIIQDLYIRGQITRQAGGNDGGVLFNNCNIDVLVNVPPISIDAAGGVGLEFLLRMKNCWIARPSGTNELVFIGSNGTTRTTCGFQIFDCVFTCYTADPIIKIEESADTIACPWVCINNKFEGDQSASDSVELITDSGGLTTIVLCGNTYNSMNIATPPGTYENGSINTNTRIAQDYISKNI